MPDLAMLDYFYGDEAEQFTFYRIPKVLFTDPSYRRISSDAKILYGLMLDRMGLSVRNGWLDEYNRVFIFFTLEDALEYLCCGHTKAVYRKTKAADKPAFRAAHETDLLLHEAAKRAFDALGVKKLPTVKVLQAEYTDLLAKKKAAYEDFKRLRQENQELQAVKSNVDSLLQIKQEEKKEQKQEKKQEQDR